MRGWQSIVGLLGVGVVFASLFLHMYEMVIAGCGLVGFPALCPPSPKLRRPSGWMTLPGEPDKPYDKPITTKLDKLIEEYMARDPLDPSSTLNFLMEVDALEDPFAESDLWSKIREREVRRKNIVAQKAAYEHVLDDLARAYASPSHNIGGRGGSFTVQSGYGEKPAPYCRDDKGRFCKKPEMVTLPNGAKKWFEDRPDGRRIEHHSPPPSVHPMDEPFPVIYPRLGEA